MAPTVSLVSFGAGAVFGPEGLESRYRYGLWRAVGPAVERAVLFVLLNPSTATHERVDPTVRRCVGYARAWGFGTLMVGNLFAERATNPRALYQVADPVGPENDAQLVEMARRAELVICGWGTHGDHLDRGDDVAQLLSAEKPLHALRVTKGGAPGHPLYLPADLQPALFKAQRRVA